MVQLLVKTDPPPSLRVNSQALCRILRSWLQTEVDNDAFLARCGVRVYAARHGLKIGFAPKPGLRINRSAVSRILERRLSHRVSQDAFLDKCNIQLTIEEAE